jgi:membrane-associated phospholipid phosphatase
MSREGLGSPPAKQRAVFGFPLGLLCAITSLLLFGWLCELTRVPATQQFDLRIRTWIHSFASPSFTSILLFFTQLGSWYVLFSAAVLLAILFVKSRFSECRLLTITIYGAIVLAAALKVAFHTPRPEPFFGLAVPTTHAFPSAHALVSFCFFSWVAGIISKSARSRSLRWCVWGLAGFVIFLIGLSRVYLGVQYASSVLAGYAAAIVWMGAVKVFRGLPIQSESSTGDDRG